MQRSRFSLCHFFYPILACSIFFSSVRANGQTANPSSLDFAATTPIGMTSSQQVMNISATTTPFVLKIDGPNKGDFFATSTTPTCTDSQLKNLSCTVSNTAITLTIKFKPTSTASEKAYVYSVSATGDQVKLATLTGTGEVYTASGCSNLYSDCDQLDLGFSLLAGIEQSYLSSQENQTNGFIRAFTKVNVPLSDSWTVSPWAIIRDLGAPSANSNQNLVSAIGNPDGTITSSSLSTVGYSLDFLIGVGFDYKIHKTQGQYSLGPIVAIGATTPLSSTSSTVGYVVPSLGTEECAQLQSRFASAAAYKQGYSSDLVPGTSTNDPVTMKPNTNCLFNIAGGGDNKTAVTTLAFSGTNRSNFLEKWEGGLRTIYRSYSKANQSACDSSNACNRGVVDLTIGQDASITGGHMHHFVFKADGVQPFPYTSGYLYIFGTVALRFEKNINLQPLVLVAASSSNLQNIPSPSVFVEPFMQPDKDFYRIGVGLSIDKIFTTLKNK